MTKADSAPSWWLVPQALVWIATRSEQRVSQANGIRTLAGLRRMMGIKSPLSPSELPVSMVAAPDELLRAWNSQRIALYGRVSGTGPPQLIINADDLCLRDFRGEVCLGKKTLYFDTAPFWAGLLVRADDCKFCWRQSGMEAVRPGRQPIIAHRPSRSKVLAFFEEKRGSLRAEHMKAGRDVLLRAAMDHFRLARKEVLEIWNSAPRNRKGGRPRKVENLE